MSDSYTLTLRRFMTNRLLSRRQFVLEVVHPGRANVSKADLAERIAKTYRVQDPNNIVLFGFKTVYGGGRSTGFGYIYDNTKKMVDIEPKHRLRLKGLEKPASDVSRKQRKERKNRLKKLHNTEKVKGKRRRKRDEE